MSSCTKEDFGISSIENPYSDKQVSMYGETITVSFLADAAWDAELVLGTEGEWAKITRLQCQVPVRHPKLLQRQKRL